MLLTIQSQVTVRLQTQHFSNSKDQLQCKEFKCKDRINGFQLKTIIFIWWWLQLIFHSANNVCLHQLTNSSFPCNTYFICKNIWNLNPITCWRLKVKLSCPETSYLKCKLLWDCSLHRTNLLSNYMSPKFLGAINFLLWIYSIENNTYKSSNTVLIPTMYVCVCVISSNILLHN